MFTDTKKISEAGAWVHLKDGRKPAYWTDDKGAVDESRPARIKMLGPDSETLQKRARKRVAKRNSGAPAENMADATLTWENIPGADGKPLEFSPDNALWLYEAYPAIVRQLREEAGEIDDFLELAGQN